MWSQSLFYWITYSYQEVEDKLKKLLLKLSQSLFYWITYSYGAVHILLGENVNGLNPYFIGLPILILSIVLIKR